MRTLLFTTAILLAGCDTPLSGDDLCADETSVLKIAREIVGNAAKENEVELKPGYKIDHPAEVKSESVDGKTMCRAQFMFPDEPLWWQYTVESHGKDMIFVEVLGG